MKNWMKRHKILVGLLALILFVNLAGLAFVWGKLNLLQYDEGNRHDGTDAQQGGVITKVDMPEKPKEEWGKGDVVNILLIGTDERSDRFNVNARSDSMMVLSLNKKAKTIKLVSLQRGIGVPILEGIYEGEHDWLTHVFRYGGADLLMRTIRECFNLDVSRYVRVNLHTMEQALDVLGGVDVELTAEEADFFNLCNTAQKDWKQMQSGINHLDGRLGLTYARLRAIDDDWHRVQRQRNVLTQCFNKAKTSSLSELNSMVDQILPLVMTNLSKTEIASLMLMAPGFLSADIDQMTIPVKDSYTSMEGMEGRILYDIDFEKNNSILHEFLYGKA